MILFLHNKKLLHLHRAILIPAHLRKVGDTAIKIKRRKSVQPGQDQGHTRGKDLRKEVNINVQLPPDPGQGQDLMILSADIHQDHLYKQLETLMASGKRVNEKR